MWRPIHSVRLALVIAAALATGGCGSGSAAPPGGASESTAPSPVAEATLGSAGFFPGYLRSKGFGTPRPTVIDNGGDPIGDVGGIRWRKWGSSTATGDGFGFELKPQGGYYKKHVVVELRAKQLGACRGRRGYHRLFSRRQRRPHGGFGPWESWWPPPHDDICGYSGISR
jgi:hypothetical protein